MSTDTSRRENTRTGGLTLRVPKNSVAALYCGMPTSSDYFKSIKEVSPICPTDVCIKDGFAEYFYANLEIGLYHAGAHIPEYTAVCQIIYYTEEKAERGWLIELSPTPHAKGGHEGQSVMLNTEEFISEYLQSEKDSFGKEYERLFNTPQFLRPKDYKEKHQQTTNEELLDFVYGLEKTCKHMHVFKLGKSAKYGYDIPLVLFTKEEICGDSLEAAAEKVKANGKPTVQYLAHVHGNEPISSEGALAMILDLTGEYGNRVLESVDVYIVPRMNPDGAYDVIRTSSLTGEDMNRDYMHQNNEEVRLVVSAYNLFLPELAIDAHERAGSFLYADASRCTDIEVQLGTGSLNHPDVMRRTGMEIALMALKRGRDLGLRTHFYQSFASAMGGAAGSSYFGARNSISFLVETPGNASIGTLYMARRVLSQYVLASTVIDYAVENARALVKTVKESREKMAKLGQVYDENNLVVLEHGRTATGTWGTPIIHVPSGKLVNPNEEMPYDEHTEAVHTRVRPTAYVIPIGTEHEEEILRVVSCHAIPYYVLPEKSRVLLKQYIENDGKTEISEEKAVLFEKGAYVFPNTVPSTVLSMLMESDFGRSSGRKISLFSMGLVEVSEDGKLPIYRYCHNLKDGEIKQI